MPDIDDRHPPQRLGGRHNATVLAGVLLATALTFVAQPVVAVLWAGAAIAGGIVFLVQDRPGRPAAIAAIIFAGTGLMWTFVQLGALY